MRAIRILVTICMVFLISVFMWAGVKNTTVRSDRIGWSLTSLIMAAATILMWV